MSEDKTAETNGAKSFEERVFVRFDAVDSRIDRMDARLERLEAKQYDTKPIWERVLDELESMNDRLASFDRKIDVLAKEMLQLQSDQLCVHRRVDKLESRGV